MGERRRTNYQIDTQRDWLDESFEIKLRNRKQEGTVEIRPLEPLPESYPKRYTNAQALIGMRMLKNIDAFNALNRTHAAKLSAALKDVDGIQPPASPLETESVYYQYCIRAADPDLLKHRAIRSGVDVEIMHVDICNVLDLFEGSKTSCPVAEGTEHTLQLPVYASLEERDLDRIISVIREAGRPSRHRSSAGGFRPVSLSQQNRCVDRSAGRHVRQPSAPVEWPTMHSTPPTPL